jgi:hypothetical protein
MSNFPVDRIKDNRLQGLLRELLDAIKDEDDPEKLRKLGQSLRLIGDSARSKAFDKTRKHW